MMDDEPEPVGGILRLVRAGLGIVGGLMFGFGSGTIFGHILLTLVTGGIRQDGWGAAPAWAVICLFCGLIGAIVGVVMSISILRSNFYKSFQWIDVLLILFGCVIAIPITYICFLAYYPLVRLIPMCASVPATGFLVRWGVQKFVLNR